MGKFTQQPPHRATRRCTALLLAVAMIALAACKPPPDGRDLGLEVISSFSSISIGQQGEVSIVVTNHGDQTATGAKVAVDAGPRFSVDSFSAQGATQCGVEGSLGLCDLGDLPPGASRVVGVEVTATGTTTAFADLTFFTFSDGTEPTADPHVNSATRRVTVHVVSPWDMHFEFDPVAAVPVGTEFDVPGVAVMDESAFVLGQIIYLTLPSNLEAVSVTLGSTTTPCTPTGSCDSLHTSGAVNGTPVSMRLRALTPAPPANVKLTVAYEPVTATGTAVVQVVDATVTSEVHPTLDAITPGKVGSPKLGLGAIRNSGSTDHTSVTATIDVAPTVDLVAASWGDGEACTAAGSTATCEIGAVPAHGNVPIAYVVRPLVAGPATVTMSVSSTTPQDVPDPFSDTTSTTFGVAALFVDLGLTPSVSQTPAVEAAPWTLSPTVKNHGNSAATNTSLTVTIPDGVEITSFGLRTPAPPDSGECTQVGQQVTCEVGTLFPGATARVDVSSEVVVGDTGTAHISATSDQAEPAPDPNTNHLSHELSVVPARADLWSSTQVPNVVASGQPLQIRSTIANAGPSRAESNLATFTVPSDWTITTAELEHPVSSERTPCTISGVTATCAIASISAPQVNFRTVHLTVVPGAPGTGLTVTSHASSATPDPNPANNTATRTVEVVPYVADVGITAAHMASVEVNAVSTVEVTVTNAGVAPATDLVVAATLPEHTVLEGVETADSGFTCTTADRDLTCTKSSQTPGSATFGIDLRHTQIAPVSFTVEVQTSAPEGTDELANSALITQTVTQSPATLSGVVVDEDGDPAAGAVWVHLPGDAWPAYSAVIAADGSYQIAGIAPGDYEIQFRASETSGLTTEWYDDSPTRAGASVLTTAGMGEALTVDAELAPAAHTVIHGRVSIESGSPVPYATVKAYRVGGFLPAATVTANGSGNYFLHLPPGSYQLLFEPPSGRVDLRPEWFDGQSTRATATVVVTSEGGQVERVDVSLDSKDAPRITGTILDEAGQPVAGATVSVFRPENTWVASYTTTTGADGSYAVTVTDGTYQVRFTPPTGSELAAEWFDDQPLRANAASLVADALDQVITADAVLSAAP